MHILKEAIPEINRILVTDDDPDVLFATSRILTNAGFVVSQASSGEEAIEKARCFGPDLMLVDVVMPHVDGYEVCRRIRAEKQFEEIAVILLSGISNTPRQKAKGLDNGADDFISRPFDAKEFLSRIRSILRIKAMEKQKRELEKHLRRSQKLESLGTLAGGIAHDFNNILSSIIGFTELSFLDVKEGKSVTGNLNEIYSAGLRAVELVRQILTFARQAPHHVEPVKIGTIVKEVCNFLGSSLPSTIEISRNISSHAHVMADPTHIHQLLMNLCTNSAHAMEENGGRLDIVLSMTHLEVDSLSTVANVRRGDYVELMVSDTGKGIPAHLYEKIFDPYFTTKPPEEGTGLGLATAHGIVEQCRGYITVDSQKGVGTCFRIYLPAAQNDGIVVPVAEDFVPCGTEHILFVDDEPSILKFGSLLLKNIGYQVTTRGSSVDALDLFRTHPDRFDLVITDMTMPVMTGDILAREIKKISPEIPVILCTGYSQKISMETSDSLGVDALAFKPMVKSKLAQTIRRLLDNAKS